MAFTVRFFSFTKRENSTKFPTAAQQTSGITANCVLIDDTSIMNPTFKLDASENIKGYNYCYCQSFARCYFITDIRSHQNFWYVSCTCDVLATYKSTIGSSSHYILRAASESDGTISDEIYPTDTQITSYVDYVNETDPLAASGGTTFVFGIVSHVDEVTHQFGSVVYYMLNGLAMRYFLEFLLDNIDDWSYLHGEYSVGVQKALVNPIQYIKSVICMPVQADFGITRSSIKFGSYEWPVPGGATVKSFSIENSTRAKEVVTINVRKHPQAATRGSYLNCQPYSSYTLHFGPWGDIDIDPLLLTDNSSIKLETRYDMVTGLARLLVTGNNNIERKIYNGTTKVGVDVQMSQIYADALGYQSALTNQIFNQAQIAGSMGPFGTGLVSGLAGIMGEGSSGVQNMTRLKYPTVSGVGSSGSYLSMYDPMNLYLTSRFNHVVDENNAELGRPLCKLRQINTLSGYILCSGADCQITGTQEEAIKVNQYMNTGFFYE